MFNSALRKLGFAVHWGKVVDPTRIITFLGIELDSISMSLRLPQEKLQSFQEELQSFLCRKRATPVYCWERLSWAANVVRGRRVFLRHIFDRIGLLKHKAHKTLISQEVHNDLLWWFTFLETFNGWSVVLDQQPLECVSTDACEEAAGGSFFNDWFYYNWEHDFPLASTFHINEKKVLAAVIAAHRWSPLWINKSIIVYSDNMVTVSDINIGTSRNPVLMQCLRKLFWLSATFNFHLNAPHIWGIFNVAADCASRLHLPGYFQTLLPCSSYTPLFWHMSLDSFYFLLDRFQSWIP